VSDTKRAIKHLRAIEVEPELTEREETVLIGLLKCQIEDDSLKSTLGIKETVHLIRAWSTKPEDEVPVCGACSYSRTIYRDAVTCEDCLKHWAMEYAAPVEKGEFK